MPSKQYMTVAEAAKLSQYNREYVRRLLREGKLQGQQIGPTWLVNRASLTRYIKKHGQLAEERLAQLE